MGRPGSWWDNTWNPVAGCFAVSPGCDNCYAAKYAATQQRARGDQLYQGVTDWAGGQRPVFNGTLTALPLGHPGWTWPLRWRGAEHPVIGDGGPSLIFIGDMCDVFHEDRPREFIDKIVTTMVHSDHLGLLLTKRADQIAAYFSEPLPERTQQRRQRKLWLGFSAERQQEFDRRWEHMRALAAAGWTTFVSVAPMIGPVTLPPHFLDHGDRVWVICSGEQSREARPMDPGWARALLAQCREAGVPFNMLRMGRGQKIPDDLNVREFPRRASDASRL